MSQHTPGPWRIGEQDSRDVAAYLIVADKGASGLPCIPGTANGRNLEHALADARLIAAAPMMLEALELLAEWRDVLVQNYPDMSSLVRAAHLARAILRDVEGQS